MGMHADSPIYGTANPAVLRRIPSPAGRVLDVGCGDGTLGRALRVAGAATVWGITWNPAEAARADGGLDRVVVADLEAWTAADLAGKPGEERPVFDTIVCSHVLEHLADPGRLVRELRHLLAPGGRLVVALPNVLHWRQRCEFLRGRFRYTRGGLMDATHLRFFDASGSRALLSGNGWLVDVFVADGTFPGSRFLGAAGRWLDRRTAGWWPGLIGFQFVLVGRPAPEFAPPVELPTE
jgi:SAM-dependent methyltransferase